MSNDDDQGGIPSDRIYPAGASGIAWTAIYPDPEGLDEFISKLEGGLATASPSDPRAVEFRSHAQPLVDAYRGRTSDADVDELARHATWLVIWMRQAGAQVRSILEEVEAKIRGPRD